MVKWAEYADKIINTAAAILIIAYGVIYVLFGASLGLFANLVALIPILFIAIHYGMRLGAITGFGISLFISIVRIINNDPEFRIINALLVAILVGVGGVTYGLLSDQRKALRESETKLEEKVANKTIELSNLVEKLEQEIVKRRATESEIRELNQKLKQEVKERTLLSEELQQLNAELEIRVRERTNALEEMVDLMSGREVRMTELKKVIKQLRRQLENEGLQPVADDPLNKPFGFQ